MNQPQDTEEFLVLVRIHPVTGKPEYCTHGGYQWSENICYAKQYSKIGTVKGLATYAKESHKRSLAYWNDPKNAGRSHPNKDVPVQPYEYKIIKATKYITLDLANAQTI